MSCRDKQIIAWKSFEIGNGMLFTEDDLKKICPSPPSSLGLIVHDAFILPRKEEGVISRKRTENVNEVIIENEVVTSEQPVMQGTFSCIEPGCTKIFQIYSNLEAHILFGKHKLFLNSKSSFDDIKNKWKESCSSIVEHPVLSRNSRLGHGDSSTEMGWALKRDRKRVRFDHKVKDYLRGIYAGGEGSGSKASPADVVRNMRVCRDEYGRKMFSPEQYLLPSQVASFFSRLSLLSRNPMQQTQQKVEDEDLESAIQMIDIVEAMNSVNSD